MTPLAVGDRVLVEVGPVAHGGHCVARHDGRVLFVRHALPGERVVVEISSLGPRGRYVRADAVEVLEASADRRVAPCPVAHACGGCDWQHAAPHAARRMKGEVVREAFGRFAGLELEGDLTAEGVGRPEWAGPGGPWEALGLGWRTRALLSVDGRGRAGLRAPRSHDVVAVPECPQLDPRLGALDVFSQSWPPGSRIRVVAPAEGEPRAAVGRIGGMVTERAAGRRWAVAADGFWQVHPGAADALVSAVRRAASVEPGDRVVDLYCGVGLFGLSLARFDGPLAGLTLVEGDRRACALARSNGGDVGAAVVQGDVEQSVGRPGVLAGADVVVLDPPRVGAGSVVVRAAAAARPRRIVYVACDPVTLARDCAELGTQGYRLAGVVALDLFPTTHHVECVACFQPDS